MVSIDDFAAVHAIDLKRQVADHGLAEIEEVAAEFPPARGRDLQREIAGLGRLMTAIFLVTQGDNIANAFIILRADAGVGSDRTGGNEFAFVEHRDIARFQREPGS